MKKSKIIAGLLKFLPTEIVSDTQADRVQHSEDQSAYPASLPDVVVWPRSRQDVTAVLQYANKHYIPVTAWGAGTSIEGNPIPVRGGIILSFRDMDQIVAIHEEDFQITVQPGLLYKDMNKVLAQYGLFFPPDPGANASIGGMLANNAAGSRTVKYGATRDNVLALEVVLANGELLRTGSRAVKQSSGYDLTHLMVGSEGTLGIITEATLKLSPLPEHFSAATAAFPSIEAAAAAVFDIIGSGLEPAALELLDDMGIKIINAETDLDLMEAPHLFMEFSGANAVALQETLPLVAEICDAHGCLNYAEGVGRDERARLWEARHSIFEASLRHFPGFDYIVTDTAVPISQFPALISFTSATMQTANLTGSIVSHAGDGNMHVAVFYPPDDGAAKAKGLWLNGQLVAKALSLGGTSTGEHGVGIGKQKYMVQEHGETAVNLMHQIKKLLDPHAILNPGKILLQD